MGCAGQRPNRFHRKAHPREAPQSGDVQIAGGENSEPQRFPGDTLEKTPHDPAGFLVGGAPVDGEALHDLENLLIDLSDVIAKLIIFDPIGDARSRSDLFDQIAYGGALAYCFILQVDMRLDTRPAENLDIAGQAVQGLEQSVNIILQHFQTRFEHVGIGHRLTDSQYLRTSETLFLLSGPTRTD